MCGRNPLYWEALRSVRCTDFISVALLLFQNVDSQCELAPSQSTCGRAVFRLLAWMDQREKFIDGPMDG